MEWTVGKGKIKWECWNLGWAMSVGERNKVTSVVGEMCEDGGGRQGKDKGLGRMLLDIGEFNVQSFGW